MKRKFNFRINRILILLLVMNVGTSFAQSKVVVEPSVNAMNEVLDDRPNSEYLFNEESGDIVIDSKGSQNGNIFNEVTREKGVRGNYLVFAGKGYVNLGHSYSAATSAITLSTWIKPDNSGSWQGVIMHGSAKTDSYALYLNQQEKAVGFKTSGTTTGEWSYAKDLETLYDGNWHLLSVTYDGAKKIFYVDKEVVLTADAEGEIMTGEGFNLLIGAGRDEETPSMLFEGQLDEVRILSYALDASEIELLYDLVGSIEVVMVEKVKVSGGTSITIDGGTLQLVATVEPADATSQKVKWVVENGTGEATVSKDGLVKAIKDGTVLVKAMATDGNFAEGKVTVTISGQKFDQNDIFNTFNKIANWNFDQLQTGGFPPSWGGWVDTVGAPGSADPASVDGVCEMKVGLAADGANWHYQLNQSGFLCELNVPYTLKFKTWASADATPCAVDFEDINTNGYNRYGASTDAEAVGGRSEWHYTADIAPSLKVFHVIFDQVIETTVQKVQFMHSLSNETIYMDSVVLIKDSDLALKAQTLSNAKSNVQLYPNPVQTELIVSKIALVNAKVAIYNALGQKMMEKIATGNIARFNVSGLTKGVYIVKLNDGSCQKFLKQ